MSYRARTAKIAKTSLFGLSLVLVLTGAGKCSRDISDPQACVELTGERTERFQAARLALEPWNEELVASRASRGIASADTSSKSMAQVQEPHLSEYDRESWTRWAREQLVEVSNAIDAVPITATFRPARKELSALAQELVQFHGSVEHGRVSSMLKSLETMSTQSARAAAIICGRDLANESANKR
jgi:hypothetical protein